MVTPRRRRGQSGNAFVEMAIVFLPLCALMFGIIDFSMLLFIQSSIQTAAREAARFATTYQSQYNSTSCVASQATCINQVAEDNAVGFLSGSKSSYITINYYTANNLNSPVMTCNCGYVHAGGNSAANSVKRCGGELCQPAGQRGRGGYSQLSLELAGANQGIHAGHGGEFERAVGGCAGWIADRKLPRRPLLEGHGRTTDKSEDPNAHSKDNAYSREAGNAIIEFALVASFLVPLLAGAFSIGMSLAKGIQISAVCREADVLFLRSVTDPEAGLDLSQAANQSIVVRSAMGLQMNLSGTNNPNPNGSAAVILTKVVMVGTNECSIGVTPAPSGAPPWNSGNCANYNQYVFAQRIVIGNGSRFTSVLGSPPAANLQTNGSVTNSDIATNPAVRVSNFTSIMTLTPSTFTLISEMFADISYLNLFSIMPTPVVYSRTLL